MLLELLKRGADPNRQGKNADSALQMTTSVDCAKALLANGADVNARNPQGKTVLTENIQIGSVELLRCYIEAGVDVNANDSEGHTALMLLSREPRIEVAELLVAAGADINMLWRPDMSVIDYIGCDSGGLAGRSVRRMELVNYLRGIGGKTAKELSEIRNQ
jgi:hypothetical protein